MSRRSVWLVLLAFPLAACGSDSTGPGNGNGDEDGPLPPGLTLRFEPFLTAGLSSPTFLAQPLDDGRIFVVMQSGRIEVVRNGVLQTTSFLDIRSRVLSGGERGMFSIAFHPNYATNKYFYVCFTATNPVGEVRIERFTTMADNPELADPASNKVILAVPHAEFDMHNGGLVTFGPDGMLWAGLGDGGGSGDPLGNGQNFNSLLGSMLRIDVDGGDPYAIPADNPFVADATRRGEIWAKGLRNPWRFSIDARTQILHIADVGHNTREEVNAELYTTGGLNYGWNRMEGFICYPPGTTGCDQTEFTLPAIDYPLAAGSCAVTGGFVYRGSAIPGLRGHYLYSDYCGAWLRSFRMSPSAVVDEKDWGITLPADRARSFGRDFDGEPYVIGVASIYKIVAGS
jgi:glucose/arabinose dehydrogenase